MDKVREMMETIQLHTMIQVGIAKFGDVTLYCNNLNYSDFVDDNKIAKIVRTGDQLYIHLDRQATRHCDHRYIQIDLASQRIKWFEVHSKMQNLVPTKDLWIKK